MGFEERLLSIDEIKKIVYNTPGFFTCSLEECNQTIISSEDLKEYVWGKKEDNFFIQVNGVELAYTKQGTGNYIILLHGMRDSKNIMMPLAEKLSKEYCVISIDFRGHGYSDKQKTDLSTSLFAEDIIDFTEKMGIDKFMLFGHSLGASVAIEIALKVPEKVTKIILAGTAVREDLGEYRPKDPEKMLKDPAMVDGFINMLNQKFFKHKKDDNEKEKLLSIRQKAMLSWMMLESSTANSLLYLKRTNLEERLKDIKVPVLIIRGEYDPVGKQEEAQFIKRHILEVYLVSINNAGHYMFLEYLDQVVNNINDFIGEKYDLLIQNEPAEIPQAINNIITITYESVNFISKDLSKVYDILNQDTQVIETFKKIGDLYIHFEFIDIGEWATLYLYNNRLHFEEGKIGKAIVTEHVTTEIFYNIISGRINAPNAALSGMFKVEGDLYKLMEFQPVLQCIIKEYQNLNS